MPTALTVSSNYPEDGDTGIPTNGVISIVFSLPIFSDDLDEQIVLKDDTSGALIPCQYTYSEATMSVLLQPNDYMTPNWSYTVSIYGGANGPQALNSQQLSETEAFSFRTGASQADTLELAGTTAVIVTQSGVPLINYFAPTVQYLDIEDTLPEVYDVVGENGEVIIYLNAPIDLSVITMGEAVMNEGYLASDVDDFLKNFITIEEEHILGDTLEDA